MSRLESVLDWLIEERNDVRAVQTLRSLGVDTTPPTPLSARSRQSGTSSPEELMGLYHHPSWSEDHERKHSICDDKVSPIAHIAAPGTSDDMFVTLPSVQSKKKDEKNLRRLKEAIPPPEVLQKVLDHAAEWWNKITTCMVGPGGTPKELTCINSFAKWALTSGSPLEVAKVLQFHMSHECGDTELERHLELIEEVIIQDDEYMGTLSGVEVAFTQGRHYAELGQIRRAWLTTRRALSFAQLMGLHRTRINVRQDFAFWGLFQFDRFTSLMLGSPSLLNDAHCNLTFKAKELPLVMSNNGFLTRLAIVAGKVIDRVQGCKDMTFASLMSLDQEITRLGSQMPPEFWHLDDIAPTTFQEGNAWMEKSVGQIMYHQTRMVLHLPYLLRSVTSAGFEYSREACIESARSILRLFQKMRKESNQYAYRVKGIDFVAVVAATTTVMGLIGGIRPPAAQLHTARQQKLDLVDWELLEATLETFRLVEKKPFGKIASQSRRVLERLTQFRDPRHNPEEPGKIVIPFFGTITVQRGAFRGASEHSSPSHFNSIVTVAPSVDAVRLTASASTLPTHGPVYNAGVTPQVVAYNGPYLQNSQYDNAEYYVEQGSLGVSDHIPSGHLPNAQGWQNVGTFDLDQDWQWDLNDDSLHAQFPF